MNVLRSTVMRRAAGGLRRTGPHIQSHNFHTSVPQFSAPRSSSVQTETPPQPRQAAQIPTSKWEGSSVFRSMPPSIASLSVDLNNLQNSRTTANYGGEMGYQVRNRETETGFKISGSGTLETVDLMGTGVKLPKDLAAQLGIEADFLGMENLQGTIARHTVGVGVKGSVSSLLSDGDILSLVGSYQHENQRTGIGTKVEGSWSASSFLPSSLEVSDVSCAKLVEEFELEKQTARENIKGRRTETMEVIQDVSMKNGVSPITGEGLDELASMEFLDHTLNVRPGAQDALDTRNQKNGTRFQVPLSEKVINSERQESMGQKASRMAEQMWYGQNGKDGRLGPKEEAPKQKITESEGPEVEGEDVSSRKQEAPKKEAPKQKVPEQDKEEETHEQEGPENAVVEYQGKKESQGGERPEPQQQHVTPKAFVRHDDDDEEESQEVDAEEVDGQGVESREMDGQEVEGQEVEAQEVAPKEQSVRESLGRGPKNKDVEQQQSQNQSQGQKSGTSVRDQFKRDTNVQKTGAKIGVS